MVVGYVAAMADVHLGKVMQPDGERSLFHSFFAGATIGSVFASRDFVCPNAVGVDIGCGMCAVKVPELSKHALSERFLTRLHRQLVERIPTGFNSHEKASSEMRKAMKQLIEKHNPTAHTRRVIGDRHVRQIGTLGGGNHFIELLYDEEDGIWLMLHSGSRNIGNITAQHYDELAAKQNGTSKENLAHLAIASEAGQDYLRDMHFCQAYAMENRRFMMDSFVSAVRDLSGRAPDWDTLVNIHHNYCECEDCVYRDPESGKIIRDKLWITRKGATSARKGQLGIIPGSMGTGSYITRGKGESMAWSSCSHGAGRRLSRNAAKRVVGVAELNEMMEGIVWDSDAAKLVRDEAPVAYKDLKEVMVNQEDLVEVVHKLLPLMNMKGY
ncbi:hypothetical protein FOL47_005399 [Perkinsus chesapeaki]|uniref:3'-phosphate/5'-hydroxy nucleic acid ligase n=1 Tax=Perkinsus chesapeaki TaxID=330153 RepID=A0A7J6N3V1_PERCH|nr:hypothetical protein FOL47_005399 [Perkinsus chesapeaki]